MDDRDRDADQAALAEAETTIARQAEELARLRRRLADEPFAADLRTALTVAGTAATIAAPVPHQRLLEMIVETAANVIGARSGALFLIDEAAEQLIFEVALGPKAADVKKLRVPLGHGIAGLVALSGQPMAVADADQDSRQAADIAEQVGYQPQSILCVPLVYRDRVTGVLELLDKEGEPAFTAEDMHALGLFANQAAVGIEQSRTQRDLAAFLAEVVRSLDGTTDTPAGPLADRARAFAAAVEADDASFADALELAALVREIVAYGEREYDACRTLLRGFAEYLRLRPDSFDDLSMSLTESPLQ
jgi:transcriptional regulator with GAF, ATPase, and Fis domain